MARQIIAVGSAGNDGTGDTLRSGAIKMNQNFAEVYSDLASIGLLVNDSVGGLNLEGISFDQRSVVFIGADSANSTPSDTNETFLRAVEPTKDNIITLPDSTGTVALISDIAASPNILDSAAILAFSADFDSAKTITLINENSIDSVGVIGLIDTDYIRNRALGGLDSNLTQQEIDAYVTKSYLVTNNLVLDSSLAGDIIDARLDAYPDSAKFNSLALALEVSLIPDTNNSKNIGSETNRFSNIFGIALEVDSARFTYDSAFNSLSLANVANLRLANNTDSANISITGTHVILPAGTTIGGHPVDSETFMSITELKTEVAASADFAAFKTRIGNL